MPISKKQTVKPASSNPICICLTPGFPPYYFTIRSARDLCKNIGLILIYQTKIACQAKLNRYKFRNNMKIGIMAVSCPHNPAVFAVENGSFRAEIDV
jgi:hypothetical protein